MPAFFDHRLRTPEDVIGSDRNCLYHYICILLVFSDTPFKLDQNKNQNRSIDKFQNLGNERRYIYKDPCQDSGQRNISYTRYPKKCFTQTNRDLYPDAMLVLTWMSSYMADANQENCGSSPVTCFALASAMRKTKRLRRRLE